MQNGKLVSQKNFTPQNKKNVRRLYPSRSSHQLKKKIMPLDEKAVMLKLKVFPKNANVHAARTPRRKPVARRTSAAHHATRAPHAGRTPHAGHTPRPRLVARVARRESWRAALKASSTTVLRLYPRSKSVSHYVLQLWLALQIAAFYYREAGS